MAKLQKIQGGLTHEGQKYEKFREVNMPETMEELVAEFQEATIVSYFNGELRRKVAEELRQELRQELGIRSLTQADKRVMETLASVMDSLGLDYAELDTPEKMQQAIKAHLG